MFMFKTTIRMTVWGRNSRGSPLPASPEYISGEQHRENIYPISAEQHRPTPAEQHRMFVYAPWKWRPLGVETPESGGPSPEWQG